VTKTIPDEILELYPEVEQQIMPFIRSYAQRLRPPDQDDAIQEARMALLGAMSKYNFNKGALGPYLRACVANTCKGMAAKSVQKQRIPWVPIQDANGEWRHVPVAPLPLDEALEVGESTPAPEEVLCHREQSEWAGVFEGEMLKRLDRREKAVLRAKLEEPTPSNLEVAARLGLTKNQIDHSLLKIRTQFASLSQKARFSALFQGRLERGDMAQPESKLAVLPHCITEYERGDEACDGTNDGRPCIHRDHCVALKIYCAKRKIKPTARHIRLVEEDGQEYAVPQNVEKLEKILGAVIKNYKIKGGRAHRVPTAPKEQKATSTSKAKTAKVQRTSGSIALDEWYERWVRFIARKLGRNVAKGDNPKPGELVVKDRRDKSGYIGLYCKPESGRPIGLGYLQYKPGLQRMDVKMTLKPGDFAVGKNTIKTLHPVDHNDGIWVSICRNLDEKSVMLSAEVIVKMCDDNIIRLPAAP